uniref:Uncharacterized protein n=1 Tax=Anguilla anguilla TaxID=7936 RepID=A0A0E9PQZ0_ANGAN
MPWLAALSPSQVSEKREGKKVEKYICKPSCLSGLLHYHIYSFHLVNVALTWVT